MCIRDSNGGPPVTIYLLMYNLQPRVFIATTALFFLILNYICLLYTSDAADERSSVDLGGRRIIKKKT